MHSYATAIREHVLNNSLEWRKVMPAVCIKGAQAGEREVLELYTPQWWNMLRLRLRCLGKHKCVCVHSLQKAMWHLAHPCLFHN